MEIFVQEELGRFYLCIPVSILICSCLLPEVEYDWGIVVSRTVEIGKLGVSDSGDVVVGEVNQLQLLSCAAEGVGPWGDLSQALVGTICQ